MLQTIDGHAAIAAPDHQNLKTGRHRGQCQAQEHPRVGQHLVIDRLVLLRALDNAVKHQHLAQYRRVDDHDVLKGTALAVQYSRHTEAAGDLGIEILMEPKPVVCFNQCHAVSLLSSPSRQRRVLPARAGTYIKQGVAQ